ncbi:MAG: HEAT repeat domain-containing protein [Sedimentisphaerales bacterium]|nr:HEAT repeat domain-containing protein [Sedimentisphaerales bacterium]
MIVALRSLIVLLLLTICTFGYVLDNNIEYNFSPKAVENVPDIVQMANSANLNDRISILDRLIVRDHTSDTWLYRYAYDLPPEDYSMASMSVLDGGLFNLNDSQKVQDVFGKIVQAAIQFKLTDLLPRTVAFLEYNDNKVKIQTLMILKRLEAKQYAKEIVKAASNPDRDVSLPALQMLMEFDVKEAVPILISCLKKEENFGLKMRAIESLGRIGDCSAIPHLIPLLKTDLCPWTLDTLVSLDAKEATPYIKELYKQGQENNPRVIISLVYFGDEQAISDIIAKMTDEEFYNGKPPSETYLEQLVKKNARPVIPALIKVLEEEQAVGGHTNRGPNVVHRIMISLAKLKATEAIPVLKRYLEPQSNDSSLNVFFECGAIEALGIVKAREVVSDIQLRLDSNKSITRTTAAMALARIGEPSSVENLITKMRKHKIKVQDILEELANISDPNTYLKLSSTKIPLIESVYGREFFMQISEKCVIEFSISDKIQKIDEYKLTNSVWSSYTGLSALNLAISIFNNSGESEATYFIDDNIVHIVTFEEAYDLWENWAAEYKKSHPEDSD